MKKYDLDFTPTDSMASEAQRALDWRKEGNRGGTPVGVARARQLINKQNLSPSTVKRMYSFFSRHEVDKQAQGFSPGEEGYPSPGRVAWGLWGGDAGFSWSRTKVNQMNRIDEKDGSASVKATLQNKVKEHNKEHKGKGKRVTLSMLTKVFNRGVGAYNTNPQSVRPSVTSPEQWAFARVNSFLYAVINGRFRSGKHDTDLLPKGHPMRGEKMFVLNTTIKKISEDADYITIRGMASTKDTDRVGDIMDPDCWTKGGLDNYMANPIILFNHDYNRPIGRGTDVKVTKNGLELTAKISKADRYISKLIQDGVLSTFSVGFKVREADHMKETGGLRIKDAELYEVSVVSIPANQAATFEIVKCFSPTEFELYKSGLTTPKGESETDVSERKINMNEEELKALVAKQTAAAVKMAMAERDAAEEKALKEKEEAGKLEDIKQTVAVAASGTEKLLAEVKATFEANREATQGEIETLKAALKDRGEEVKALQNSKRQFIASGTSDWKKAHEGELRDAFMLGKITGKGWNSEFGKDIINKVSNFSGVEIPAAASVAIFETIAATSIERDIQNELILATLFREIPMTSAAMALPILPDAGYAEFITQKAYGTASDPAVAAAPHGNLDERTDTAGSPYEGIDLGSKTLTTKKLVSLTFLANETEEDAILPILPLINESMVRAHARAVERAMLRGSSSIGSFDGLTTLATTNSDVVTNTTAFASDALTSDHLIGLRKAMGKYGVRPSEVVYIVSERAYFELLEDPEFKDVSLVGQTATKLRGEIGNVYGSRVVLCDEFVTPAASAFFALAVNPRNFVVPRLRGVTLESQYVPRLQHRELIATQRLGFDEIITGATAVTARKYHSS